MLSNRRRAL